MAAEERCTASNEQYFWMIQEAPTLIVLLYFQLLYFYTIFIGIPLQRHLMHVRLQRFWMRLMSGIAIRHLLVWARLIKETCLRECR